MKRQSLEVESIKIPNRGGIMTLIIVYLFYSAKAVPLNLNFGFQQKTLQSVQLSFLPYIRVLVNCNITPKCNLNFVDYKRLTISHTLVQLLSNQLD